MLKKIFLLFSLCTLFLLVGQTLFFLRSGFTPKRFLANLPYSKNLIDDKTKQILSQDFHFLARGRQCYAFASEDGKYVLKLLRADKFKIPFWMRILPFSSFREKKAKSIERKYHYLSESFRLAKEELSEITGTLAVHWGSVAKQQITVTDALNISHRLPLHETIFILQHKRPLWTPLFHEARKKNDKEKLKILLDSFIDTVIVRAKIGILNRDESFWQNYAFENGKSYQIDIGDFYRDPTIASDFVFEKATRETLAPMQRWLKKLDPELFEHVNSRLEKLSLL